MKRGVIRWGVAAAALAVAATLLALPGARLYWRVRSSNPVRRGLAIATEAGCFSCHGPLGTIGVPDPALGDDVPSWSGGVWMMYLEDETEIAEFVRDGISRRRAASERAASERKRAAIRMPAYRGFLSEGEIEDVTAAFVILSGMKRPDVGTAEARGREIAFARGCFSCHAPGGSGGHRNPGSFTGFIPGWYGPDFLDLVRERAEFDEWIREGHIARVESHPIARRFLRRQRIRMPAYRDLAADELDALWSYVEWLGRTRGGLDGSTQAF